MSNLLRVLVSPLIDTSTRDEGVDLSHWDKSFDPGLAKKKVGFAFMKLTEPYLGPYWTDPSVNEMWAGVKWVDVRGGFHYLRSGVSWRSQADKYLEVARRFDLQINALDVEPENNILNDTFFSDVRRVLDYWREKDPTKKNILYTNWDLYKQLYYAFKRLFPADGVQWLEEQVPLWYAWPSKLLSEPVLPLVRSNPWTFWQKAWDGLPSDWGTGSAVDVNEFRGTHQELLAWIGVTPQPDDGTKPDDDPIVIRPEITPETTLWSAEVLPLMKMVVRTYPLKVDDTKTANYIYGGEVFKGRIWSGNDYVWIRIDEYPQRLALVGKWVAVRTPDAGDRFIRLRALNVVPTPTTTQLWQLLHDVQLGEIRQPTEGNGAPEVFPMMDKHFTRFTREWQMFSYELMALPAKKWRAVFTWKRALANRNGFENPADPRADYVNKMDMSSDDPKFASLLFGGNVITGREDGEYLWVETLDGNLPPPSVAWAKERPWLVQTCTNVTYSNGHVGNFPQGDGLPVVVPVLASKPVRITLKNLRKLPPGSPIPKVYWP
jgi:GH25 family lysozyme M1 (1,4-beta-N-acetylmuramidase)